ncbi:MAG: hypothetical protein ACOX5F_04625 [Anaerovoracaceae bacterium]|jgi:hypothetical protein
MNPKKIRISPEDESIVIRIGGVNERRMYFIAVQPQKKVDWFLSEL